MSDNRDLASPTSEEEEYVDEVPCITARHFEEAMKYARKSVSEEDLHVYEMFAARMHSNAIDVRSFKFKPAADKAKKRHVEEIMDNKLYE